LVTWGFASADRSITRTGHRLFELATTSVVGSSGPLDLGREELRAPGGADDGFGRRAVRITRQASSEVRRAASTRRHISASLVAKGFSSSM
jgi:hypothetical protein